MAGNGSECAAHVPAIFVPKRATVSVMFYGKSVDYTGLIIVTGPKPDSRCRARVNSKRKSKKIGFFQNDIEILLGLETEYYPETYGKFMEFITPYKLDYLIMGQHFVGNEYDQNSYYSSRPNRDETLLERYVAQVCEGLRKGVFTYIAHPDILYYEGEPGYYRDKMAELCVCAKELGIPLEYNLLGMTNKKCYPKPEFWKLASEIGNDVLIGYDAHNPDALQNDEAFFNCVLNLNAMGLSPMEFSKIKIRNVQNKNR